MSSRKGKPNHRSGVVAAEEWANTLRQARIARNMTQEDIAALCNVTPNAITCREGGRTSKVIAGMQMWASVLGYEWRLVKPTDAVQDAIKVLTDKGWTVEPPTTRGSFW